MKPRPTLAPTLSTLRQRTRGRLLREGLGFRMKATVSDESGPASPQSAFSAPDRMSGQRVNETRGT